jgi:ribosome-associated protein
VLIINRRIRIPFRELEFSFARSSGPGGQNVNKVNSKVILRWNVSHSITLPSSVRDRFIQKYGTKLTTRGDLVLSSDRFRTQQRNREECLRRLKEMLLAVALPPKKRKKTRPSKAAKQRRIDAKKRQGEKKRTRQKNWRND